MNRNIPKPIQEHTHIIVIECIYLDIKINVYMGVVLNKSSQEPPFRKFFASFRGPIRVAFSKIKNSYQESNIWNQTNSNTNYTINRLLFARINWSNQNVIVICCFFSLGPISGMAKCSPFWAGHGSSGYVFRASFARLSLEIVKKWVDTIAPIWSFADLPQTFRQRVHFSKGTFRADISNLCLWTSII